MKGIPKMTIIDYEVALNGSLAAISILVEYIDHETIDHDTLYIIYDTEEPAGSVPYELALELAERLCNINR